MAQRTTLGALVDQHFGGTLLVTNVGDMKIAITNDPDFDAGTFTVEATGTDKNYRYPLFGNQALSLEDISLTLTYNGPDKAATGTISGDLDFGGIDLDVRVTLSRGTESFSVISQLTDPISLLKVVDNLASKKVAAPPGLAKIRIKSIGMSIAVDDKTGRTVSADCQLDQNWVLPVGGQSVDVTLAVEYQGKGTVELETLGLTGELALTKARRLDVSYEFGPKLSKLLGELRAGGPPVGVADLLRFFGISVSKGFPNSMARANGIDLAQAKLELDFANNLVQLSGENSLKDDAFAYAQRIDDKWRLALGLALGPGWRMASLSGKLQRVDDFLSFEQAFVAVATDSLLVDDSIFARMGAHQFQLCEGLNVGAAIALDSRQSSLLAKALHGLLGGDTKFFLEAVLGPTPDEISFSASLGGELDIGFTAPGVGKRVTLSIKSPTLKFSLQPSLSLSGEVAFPATTGKVDITGAFTVTPDSLSFRGHADGSSGLTPPKQAAGLVLKGIGGIVEVAPGTLEIGLDGTMFIDKDKTTFAFDFAIPEMFPAFLYAQFDSLDLAPMFKALCKSRKLPKQLSSGIQFRKVTIWSCEDPSRRCTFSDGTQVDAGFAFAGGANVFGFPAQAALAITTAGMSGRLDMGRAISVPKVFTVSDANDHTKGPQFEFNTKASPYLQASYYVDVLGVQDTARLDFTQQGFVLDTSVAFKGEEIRFTCVLGAAPGQYVVQIEGTGNFKKHPITIYKSTLVTLKLSYVDISFSSKSGNFSARAEGKLGKLSKTAHVQISLAEIGHKLAQLGQKLEQELGKLKNWV